MTYPVLTLPFDIISQIFVYCLPPLEDNARPWRTDAPLLLTRICREWRDIALCTHDLWNTMHLDLRAHSVLKVAPLLDFWIPRAGNLPLSMSLLFKDLNYKSEIGLDALVALIARYARHWTTIELHMPISALMHVNPSGEKLASLKKLVLNCESGFHGDGKRVARGFSCAPQLREVHMMAGLSPESIALPWQQLATFRLDNSNAIRCLQALALVPNVANFTTTLWSFGGTPPATILSLPRLESFNFVLSHERGPALLRCLTLPALRTLELDIPGAGQLHNITDLLLRSSCFLRRLSVKLGPTWTGDDFARLLGAMDTLEELEIRKGGEWMDAVFRLLTAQPRLLPNLRLLSVERTLSRGEDAELLADLLETRWNVPAGVSLPVQLKSFRLNSPLTMPPDRESDAVLRLCRLRAEGMMVQITSSGSWL
ncbi:hypothetical protein DFH09DRAFT_1125006 [Mycena vulgaris]|nr:hypothetical protein DFH09DRAFT_1125006 [Mycena vulgaris]